MTMRTSVHFVCENGHRGEEETVENDQPYSTQWERVTLDGLIEVGKAAHGNPRYVCAVCNAPMKQTK